MVIFLCFWAKALDKIVLMFFNKIKTFYHKNGILRDYVYMVGLFLNLLDTQNEKNKLINELTKEMKAAAKLLEFEHAAAIRDKINLIRNS